MRCWKGLTTSQPPSGSAVVWENTRRHHSVEIHRPRLRRHPLLIVVGSGGRLPRLCGSFFRCHSLWIGPRLEASARVGAECGAQGLRRKEVGQIDRGRRRCMRRRGYKALSPPFLASEGFWETVPAISASSTPPTWFNGPQLGLSRNSSPRCSFVAAKYSPISPQFNEAQ